MGPWAQAVFDTLDGLASPEVMEEVLSRGMLEVLPLTTFVAAHYTTPS